VIITIIEYLKTKDNNIYFLAWEKILNYWIKNQNIYENIFNIIKDNSDLELPENINLNLIKHNNLNIITIKDEINNKIIELLENYNEKILKIKNIEKWQKIKNSKWDIDIKNTVIREHKLFLEKYKKLITETKYLYSKLNIKDNSHYDLIIENTDLKIFNKINFLYFKNIKKVLN
jgi:hypothetical protein